MSYNANLAYFLQRLEGVSTNYFRLEPQNSTTANANKIIRFSLPSNALLNTRSVAFHFNATANGVAGKGGRLPPKIESLIDRIEISSGGVTLAQGYNGQNVLAHAKQALMGNKCDSVGRGRCRVAPLLCPECVQRACSNWRAKRDTDSD